MLRGGNSIYRVKGCFDSMDKMHLRNNLKEQLVNQISNNNDTSSNNIEVSIIIPSYNKYPLNLLTLYSLEKQSFDFSKMEVLLIDDASTDQTSEQLKDYRPPYHFTYIHCNQNGGRAKVRNLGIKHAKGNILIFLDAEMIVEPDFVQNHYHFHQSANNLIVTGAMHYGSVYSCIFPDFHPDQLQEMKELVKNDAQLFQRYTQYDSSESTPFPLVDKQDIDNGRYKKLRVKKSLWHNLIVENYGTNLKGFTFPWMAFLTGNVSLRKDLITSVGSFDENFVLYGYEDWELGYRLYKAGANYILSDRVKSYHQEHPVGPEKWKEAMTTYNLFISKHPDIDVLILGLELSQYTDLLRMNTVLAEYRLLAKHYPNQFTSFKEKFIEILKTIALLLKVDIRHINVLGAAGFDSDQKAELLVDVKKLKNLHQYKTLASTVEKVITT
jgi:glycosyltransferase involved in cell wall biosynthesis